MKFKDLTIQQKDEVSVPARNCIQSAKEILATSAAECIKAEGFDALTQTEKDTLISTSTEAAYIKIQKLMMTAKLDTGVICRNLGIDEDETRHMLQQLEDGVIMSIKLFVLKQLFKGSSEDENEEECDCESCPDKAQCEALNNAANSQNGKYN